MNSRVYYEVYTKSQVLPKFGPILKMKKFPTTSKYCNARRATAPAFHPRLDTHVLRRGLLVPVVNRNMAVLP